MTPHCRAEKLKTTMYNVQCTMYNKRQKPHSGVIPHLMRDPFYKNTSNFSPAVSEVFFSYQGEGIYAGIPQIFVRFEGCNLRCNYCDTPKALTVKQNAKYFTAQALSEYIFDIYEKYENNFFGFKPSVSFTGGEPLLYADFIKELITKYIKNKFSVYMETNGTLPEEIKKVYKYCDVVAMDIKFKSACRKDLFKHHKEFLKVCKNKAFIKTVITKDTKKEEFVKAVKLVSEISKKIKFVIQPSDFEEKINKKVFEFYSVAADKLDDVRILPQLHKLWKIA